MSSNEEEGFDDVKQDDSDFIDDYEPSISDQLHAGYCNMDRACQTTVSEIIDLKKMSEALSVLVQDLAALKKNFYYAKLTLQAEYDSRLEEAVLDLYCRVNKRIAEIENVHKERVDVVRRSFRTQLTNAVCKLSNDYHKFYGNKDADAEVLHKKKLKEMEEQQLALRKNELAQQEMFNMLKMQMEDTELAEEPSRISSVVSTSVFTQEIEELKGTIQDFEGRVENLEDMLEESNKDNRKLNSELEVLSKKLVGEEAKTSKLLEKVSLLNNKMERERIAASEHLAQQKEQFELEMENRLKRMRKRMQEEAKEKIEELRKNEAEKLQSQKLAEKQKLKELQEKHENEKKPVDIPVETDVGRLQIIEKKQRAEIARLQRDLERTVRTWEMKTKILQEHIHALKDEMFLRTTLQRQVAKVRPAALTYVKKNNTIIPLGVNPTESTSPRRLTLPTVIQAPKMVEER